MARWPRPPGLTVTWVLVTALGLLLRAVLRWKVGIVGWLSIVPLAVGQWWLVRRAAGSRLRPLLIPATVLGLELGAFCGFLLWDRWFSPWADSPFFADYIHFYFWQIYATAGLILGLAQAPFVASSLRRGLLWICSSGLGLGSGALLFSKLFALEPELFSGMTTLWVGETICGLTLGLSTSFCLWAWGFSESGNPSRGSSS